MNNRRYLFTLTGLMTAVLCVIAPMSIPLPGGVPLSLANLAILLTVYLLGGRAGVVSSMLYLLLGAVGLPVFSGFSGGIGVLIGPTGGFLVGYLLLAMLAGAFVRGDETGRGRCALGMVLGLFAAYVPGVFWFAYVSGVGPARAAVVCVLPFLPGDALKLGLTLWIGPRVREAIRRSGVQH